MSHCRVDCLVIDARVECSITEICGCLIALHEALNDVVLPRGLSGHIHIRWIFAKLARPADHLVFSQIHWRQVLVLAWGDESV